MLHFNPIDVTVPHVAYAALGGFVVIFGMFSLLLRERLYVGEACWAFIFGVIVGPYGANIFNPRGWAGDDPGTVNTITLELTRVVLAIGVFAIGVELPKAYMRKHWRSLFFLLGPVMTWGWFVSAAFIYWLIPGLNFLSSLAVAACLTPTDPILAAAVVGGKWADKHVPTHIRHLLAAESGCNDGAAFPFLYLALYLILDNSTSTAVGDWFLKLWLYQIILGVVIGSFIGIGFRHLMKFSERVSLIDRHSYVAQYVSLALLTIGTTTLLGSDDLLSAFACGTAFAWDGFFNRQTEESVFSSVIDLLFNCAAFIYVGAWMPFSSFSDPSGTTLQVWRLVVIAICVMVLRRLPIMVAMYRWIPDIKTSREAIFSGHFGPIGVGAVFISTLATEVLEASPQVHTDRQVELLAKTIQPICAFMVLVSIAVHGLSIPGFSLGKRVHSVSRTWSRHTTTTAAQRPDWMDHVRHAEQGEVIVNRDGERRVGDLEMGLEREKGEGETLDGRPLEDIDIITSESPTAVGTRQGSQEEKPVENGAESPPDGEATVYEWQQGPHKVIERRAGPGEEVEVEVIRNVNGQDVSSAYKGTEEVVRGLVHKIKTVPKALEEDFDDLVKAAEERMSLSPRSRHLLHEPTVSFEQGDDEDEGWASEHDERGTSPSSERGDKRKRSGRSSKIRPIPRRRGSATANAATRKGIVGRAQQFVREHRQGQHHQELQEDSASPPVAGPSNVRPENQSAPSESELAALASRVSSRDFAYGGRMGRRSRLDSLRLQSGRPSRDASPARSVRFAEDGDRTPRHASGTSTPLVSAFSAAEDGLVREEGTKEEGTKD